MTETLPKYQEARNFIKVTHQQTTKAYKRRWLILTIYVLYAAANAFQWMEYAIIANIVAKYYNVSTLAVDWTSIIFMSVYAIIVVPACYLIDTKGLRFTALIGCLSTALAGVVKLFSVRQDLFWVILVGQIIGSLGQVFILSLPPKIAAVWFKPNEVSTACSIGIFGTQVGLALGFQIPTLLVKNGNDYNIIASDLMKLCWAVVVFMIPVVVAVIFYFPRVPPLPPSEVQIEERKRTPPTFKQFNSSLKKLFKIEGFIKLSVGFGIILGVQAAISTLLNQFVLHYFPNCEEDAGTMGFLTIAVGMIASLVIGVYLDKSHRYKESCVIVYYLSSASVVGFMMALHWESKIFSYIAVTLFGIFINAYMVTGFEFAMELTFNADESTVTGIMNAKTQGLGVLITIGLGKLNQYYGPFYSLLSQAILLLIGAVLTQMVPNQKRRQEAFISCQKENKLLVENE